ncbi:MAG: tRNA pseudouridine(38-40) synthase TruA [Spiroplasma sp.]
MSCKEKKQSKLTTYCVWIAYDGSNFLGWAKQNSLRTVAGEINKILSAIFHVEITISGASRTDTGVHAYDQIFTFSLPFFLDVRNIANILKQHFIHDIKIKDVCIVDSDLKIRDYVRFKQYRYYISTVNHNPFKINYQYQYGKKISLRKLRKALKLFFGHNYFYNFSGLSRNDKKSPYRTIDKIRVYQWKKQITIIIQAKGFLRYQIRYMIAAALDYSQDKITLDEIARYLSSATKAKYHYPKVPAQGLYLYKIFLKSRKEID